jgi:hypothetical protein
MRYNLYHLYLSIALLSYCIINSKWGARILFVFIDFCVKPSKPGRQRVKQIVLCLSSCQFCRVWIALWQWSINFSKLLDAQQILYGTFLLFSSLNSNIYKDWNISAVTHMILFLSFVQMARTQKNKATAHHLGLLKVYISFSLSWCCSKQFLNIVLIMSVEGTFIWLQIELIYL